MIDKMEELNHKHVEDEMAKGRNPDESIVMQVNEMYRLLLRGWLRSEKELLEVEERIRELEKKSRKQNTTRKKRKK
ncbi:hypothetical protein NTE_01370 [Candidatus Nitrososphaera evergladensis SR1]|uniref:Uncharacterized protein n=1 Tax=Candidatus Nitrososphaera evergladensis SR1 TaxID=1459636 RepID=A0A075MQF1_9ARCH|nr:hypothetical protein [Candidatus Nitrososphaera evergladensis]AIF83438.1 hypothetical protein NTE_01370 [Candidatus Nitrososphaera evergladensis SR1]